MDGKFTEIKYFKTPHGLKIRLDPLYFLNQLVPESKYITDEVLPDEVKEKAIETIESAGSITETIFQTPATLVQLLTIYAIIVHMSIPAYIAGSIAFHIFGLIWRCTRRDFLLNTLLFYIGTAFGAGWGLIYVILIALAIYCHSIYLIIPFIGVAVLRSLISLVANGITLSVTKKKVRVPL